ncbi:hypothetical protein [Saccharomonospora glauca]|jgi:hypothetical protein|uniref:Uncharacterized protein n=1 Tax=Saccharomonospora glauca K62 TaxID=928724 RepID=I1D6X2_9PSEU|nr:hypothetical protein [Saccharomonospora glauca]EIF00697.1 hypothetical protein SacglDRAFT_03851 [Saccharomonospora glauca K62]
MLWLFGEIWLWLLIAFVLGLALAAAAFLATKRRERTPADRPTEPTPRVEDMSDTERTQFIRPVGPRPGTGPEAEERPDEGRRQGVLPVSSSEWHARNEWPDEHDIAAAEENRPRRER